MSETEIHGQILSRDELDALLRELAESRREEEERRSVFAVSASPNQALRYAPFRRGLDRFGAEYGKLLSSTYQKRIEWSIIGWDEVSLAELAETLLPFDRLVLFALEPSEELGYIVVSRPLFFGWLCLAYGGRTADRPLAVPERAYTRIERRFLARIVDEMLQQMNPLLRELLEVRARVVGVEEPRVLLETPETTLLASFDVQGFGGLGRVRMAFPTAPLKRCERPTGRLEARHRPSVRNAVLHMPVPVRVEVGEARLPLRRLATLRPGEVIPIEGAEDGSLLVRVGGEPKFKAVRGAVGRRLAVQIVERLE